MPSCLTKSTYILYQTHSMEEADVLATRVAIISKRILALGTTDYLRHKYGNIYHVHLVLKSAPASTKEEMETVEQWVDRSFSECVLRPIRELSRTDQILCSRASWMRNTQDTEDVITKFETSRKTEAALGHCSLYWKDRRRLWGCNLIALERRLWMRSSLRVIRENNVQEEDVASGVGRRKLFSTAAWKCWH